MRKKTCGEEAREEHYEEMPSESDVKAEMADDEKEAREAEIAALNDRWEKLKGHYKKCGCTECSWVIRRMHELSSPSGGTGSKECPEGPIENYGGGITTVSMLTDKKESGGEVPPQRNNDKPDRGDAMQQVQAGTPKPDPKLVGILCGSCYERVPHINACTSLCDECMEKAGYVQTDAGRKRWKPKPDDRNKGMK